MTTAREASAEPRIAYENAKIAAMSTGALIRLPAAPSGPFTENVLKANLSSALAQTFAAVLNVRCTVYDMAGDIDSVDVEFDSGRFGPGQRRLGLNRKLEAQLKCTTSSGLKEMAHPTSGVPSLRYYLERKDYDRLAIPADDRPYPHVLVVVRVPKERQDRLSFRGSGSLIRAKAWWIDLTDWPAAQNPTSVPLYIPATQVFDTDALRSLMKEAR